MSKEYCDLYLDIRTAKSSWHALIFPNGDIKFGKWAADLIHAAYDAGYAGVHIRLPELDDLDEVDFRVDVLYNDFVAREHPAALADNLPF